LHQSFDRSKQQRQGVRIGKQIPASASMMLKMNTVALGVVALSIYGTDGLKLKKMTNPAVFRISELLKSENIKLDASKIQSMLATYSHLPTDDEQVSAAYNNLRDEYMSMEYMSMQEVKEEQHKAPQRQKATTKAVAVPIMSAKQRGKQRLVDLDSTQTNSDGRTRNEVTPEMDEPHPQVTDSTKTLLASRLNHDTRTATELANIITSEEQGTRKSYLSLGNRETVDMSNIDRIDIERFEFKRKQFIHSFRLQIAIASKDPQWYEYALWKDFMVARKEYEDARYQYELWTIETALTGKLSSDQLQKRIYETTVTEFGKADVDRLEQLRVALKKIIAEESKVDQIISLNLPGMDSNDIDTGPPGMDIHMSVPGASHITKVVHMLNSAQGDVSAVVARAFHDKQQIALFHQRFAKERIARYDEVVARKEAARGVSRLRAVAALDQNALRENMAVAPKEVVAFLSQMAQVAQNRHSRLGQQGPVHDTNEESQGLGRRGRSLATYLPSRLGISISRTRSKSPSPTRTEPEPASSRKLLSI
jgi:hypothetical protein